MLKAAAAPRKDVAILSQATSASSDKRGAKLETARVTVEETEEALKPVRGEAQTRPVEERTNATTTFVDLVNRRSGSQEDITRAQAELVEAQAKLEKECDGQQRSVLLQQEANNMVK